MFEKEVIIDCKGHLLGRLSSVIAKEILNGQKVVCVRSEDINMSGPLYRNMLKYADFKRKRLATKHSHGHTHYRAPSKILWRTIRGMVPHKTTRGAQALGRASRRSARSAARSSTRRSSRSSRRASRRR